VLFGALVVAALVLIAAKASDPWAGVGAIEIVFFVGIFVIALSAVSLILTLVALSRKSGTSSRRSLLRGLLLDLFSLSIIFGLFLFLKYR
jgi:hypothetical protein